MATITLTDRISVRVTAKDSTETSNQNKTNGGNVASALGGSDLTDSEKEELGESLGDTVTDENGTTYARSDKVAGVLKTLEQEGKFETTKTYRYGNVACIDLVAIPKERMYTSWSESGSTIARNTGLKSAYQYSQESGGQILVETNGWITTDFGYQQGLGGSEFGENAVTPGPSYAGIVHVSSGDDEGYYYLGPEIRIAQELFDKTKNGNTYIAGSSSITWSNGGKLDGRTIKVPPSGIIPITEVGQKLLSLSSYGDFHEETTSGGKLDTTGKTDAQIQKDLEDFAALNGCKMTSDSGDTYIAVTDANGNPLYFLGT